MRSTLLASMRVGLAATFAAAATLSAQTVNPPAPGPLRPYAFPPVEQFQLPNGLKVILVEKHTVPVVEARLIVDAGSMREPAAKNGLASITGSLLSEGTGSMTGADIARAMDALGAQFFTASGFTNAFADVVALKTVFPQALDLAAKSVMAPSFAASEVNRVKNRALASYAQSHAQTAGLASDAFVRAAFDESAPFSRPSSGTPATISTLTRDDIVNWHKSMYSPANSTLLLVGDLNKAEAQRIAHYLVAANLTGHDSHGVVRVPRYIQMKNDGLVHADQKIDVLVDTPALAVVDGKFGFGQTVAPQAVQLGIDKCRQTGLALVALRHAGHIGRVADWAEMAADAALVSIHFVNAAAGLLVAPFGAIDRRFSTAPYCIGVPLPGRAPLLLDFATSTVAEGKVLVASQGGRPIPADALIGPDGRVSDDPRLLYGDYQAGERRDIRKGHGALRAFGGHKGSGLALMCELLGGALTGNGATRLGRPFANGLLGIFIDPDRIDPEHFFDGEISRYIAYVKDSKPTTAGAEVLVPGEVEARTRAERLKNGVPLPDDVWAPIVAAARSVGINDTAIADASR